MRYGHAQKRRHRRREVNLWEIIVVFAVAVPTVLTFRPGVIREHERLHLLGRPTAVVSVVCHPMIAEHEHHRVGVLFVRSHRLDYVLDISIILL